LIDDLVILKRHLEFISIIYTEQRTFDKFIRSFIISRTVFSRYSLMDDWQLNAVTMVRLERL